MTQSVNKNDKFYKFVAKCKPTVLTMFSFQLLQNLGKADRTTDEIFEEHLQNFNLQQSNANRLQKDISNYIRCIRGKKWKTFF
jgi:predicted nucleic acid-binding OB-fold protein